MQHYLLKALTLAKLKRGFCSPNPAVGAVVVRDNEIIAEGFHQGPGTHHAEVDALCKLTPEQTQSATLYVTLEPCCIYGRTPPCTDLIIKSQLAKVVYAFKDPNPRVSGQGAQILNQANILCEHHPLTEINNFYQSYAYWWQHKKPWVSIKLALSKDQKIAGVKSQFIKITGPEADHYTHKERLHCDAILTTVKTILHDNPQLNARINNTIYSKPLYIIDRLLQLPESAQVHLTAKNITLFHQAHVDKIKLTTLQQRGIRCHAIETSNNLLDLAAIISQMGDNGIHDLWVEVGSHVFNSFLKAKLANRVLIYQSDNALGPTAYPANITKELFKDFKSETCFKLVTDSLTIYLRH
ncbi:MAG: riboflavin biosynthesis protein RibD [Gammaproteobacteria bacterium RIFCSPHIGHO2_12_FULL_35_23]|nr:MAG: riboflavin biosynthesis protein RibD [Gammaproteobacteria bacterium RIFCSPHIGHO2_12_FULL_35_23]